MTDASTPRISDWTEFCYHPLVVNRPPARPCSACGVPATMHFFFNQYSQRVLCPSCFPTHRAPD